MDKIDLKILQKLEENARISITSLARATRLSKEVVQYRLKKMEENDILLGSRAVIAPAKLGYMYHKVLLKFVPLHIKQEKEWLSWAIHRPEMVWVGICEGEWNGEMTIRTQNFLEFSEFIETFLQMFGELILKKEILMVKVSHLFHRKFLSSTNEYPHELSHDFFSDVVKVDEKDEQIIYALTQNARTKLTTIAQQVNLSPEAVASRLKNLERTKVIIGYRPKINYKSFGIQNYKVFLSLKDPRQKEKIISYCRYQASGDTIMEFVGCYDLQLTFLLKSQIEFRLLLAEIRDLFGSNILEYETLAAYPEIFISPVNKKELRK